MRRTKQEALETRAAILDAAEAVFFARGVGQTTLAQIAAEANLTRGAIYWHFCNKADVFKAMQDRARLPQEDFFYSREMLGAERCLDLLHETTLETVRSFACDERAKRVYSIILFRCEYVGEMGDVLVRCRQADDRMRQSIAALFRKAGEARDLRAGWSPDIATEVYFCSVVGLISEWLRRDQDFDIVATAEKMIGSLFDGYRAEPSGRPALSRTSPSGDA